MKRRSAFPAVIRSHHLPHAEAVSLEQIRSELSPESERNFHTLLRLFATEIGPRPLGFGYSSMAGGGCWLLLASTQDTDEVIGYAAAATIESYGHQVHGCISELAVLSEYRRQGVAQSLIAGVRGVFASQPNLSMTQLAAIVPARRYKALDTFIIAGFEVVVQGDEYLFQLPLNHRAPAHC